MNRLLPLTLVLAVAGSALAADAPSDAAQRGRAALDALVWPRGLTFEIEDPDFTRVPVLPEGVGGSRGHADAPISGSLPGAGARPGAGERSSAAPAVDPEVAKREQLAGEMASTLVALHQSAMDLAKLAAARTPAALLLPILLFLVEHGVMTEAERDAALKEPDLDLLVAKIRQAIARLEQERDRLSVLIYLDGVARPRPAPAR